jgi:putative ABC transport system permease protein
MSSLAFLAVRTVLRHPARTALVILGVAVAGALLLDMTMLSGGLEASLGIVLSRLGFAVRVVPRGTLPFASDAEIPQGDRLAAAIARRPGVVATVPVVGTNVYVLHAARFPSFALGVPAGGSGMYALLEGHDLPPAESRPGERPAPPLPPVVINSTMARLDGVRLGDTVTLSATPGSYLVPFAAPQAFRVVGIADFFFDLATQRSLALATSDLRHLQGKAGGGASLILVRMADPSRADALAEWIMSRDPAVDAFSIRGFLRRAGEQLTYFRQFSLILGTISVAVSFLLIAAIITISLGERLGEIAMLRALGFRRTRIAALILAEGVLLSALSVPGAVGLGLVISHPLDAILRAAPSVPEGLHFFTLTGSGLLRTIGLLLGTGLLGALYPAVLAAGQGIASTLHAEVLS